MNPNGRKMWTFKADFEKVPSPYVMLRTDDAPKLNLRYFEEVFVFSLEELRAYDHKIAETAMSLASKLQMTEEEAREKAERFYKKEFEKCFYHCWSPEDANLCKDYILSSYMQCWKDMQAWSDIQEGNHD